IGGPKPVATFSRAHRWEVLSVKFTPNGKLIASASIDKTGKLWDVGTGKERATLSGHTGAVTSVAFSGDGATLASASDDKTVKLWRLRSRLTAPSSRK